MGVRLAVLLLLAAQEGPMQVTVQTKDGNSIVGTTEVAQIVLESSLGKTTLALKDIQAIRVGSGDVIVSASDGSTLRGKISLDSWKVKSKLGEFTIKTEDIQTIFIQGIRPPQPPPRPPSGPAVPPGAAPAPQKPANPGLKPVKSLKLSASISRTLRSQDGKKLYLLNASDSKLIIVDLEGFQVEKEISLTGGETTMSLAPGGTTLVAAGKKGISVVSLAQAKVLRNFAIEVEISEVCAVDDSTVVCGTANQFVMISIPKQAVTQKIMGGGSVRMVLSKDGKRIHSGAGSILLPDKAQGRSEMLLSQNGRSHLQAQFLPSPDGRFAVSIQGTVHRLSRSFVADMMEVVRIEDHWSAAWMSTSKKLIYFTGAGFAKEYSTESWELDRSWQLGWRLTDAYLNEAGTILTGIGQPAPQGGDQVRPWGGPVPPGDLMQFEIPK